MQDGARGVCASAPLLFAWIADARTLHQAWDELAERGGAAPGPNGRRYTDYSDADVWAYCRRLARTLHDDTYRPGPERIILVDKASGKGQRPLTLLNIEDRVVQHAIVRIVQSYLDPLFDCRSFGFRPGTGHLNALAYAESLACAQRRWVLVAADIRDAFLNVPVSRLLEVVRQRLPHDRLLTLFERILTSGQRSGLRQGGPLSPLMLNVYLDHILDQPWRETYPHLPLIRFADDLLILCQNLPEAKAADAALRRLLLPMGMSLKESPRESIHNLRTPGASVEWMGFSIDKNGLELAASIAERSWRRLREYLMLAHTKNDAPLRAVHIIKQWLRSRGPCYPWSDREAVCQRIAHLARKQSFEEIPGPGELDEIWQAAYGRWNNLRELLRANQPS